MRLGAILIVLCGSSLFSSAQTTATKPLPDAGLAGFWASEQILRPLVRGTLTIDARSDPWRAQIAGFDVAVERRQNQDAVTFALPGDAGQFRGHLSTDGRRIAGNWIQPRVAYPYNQRYASPVELTQVESGVWRGEVIPLEPRLSFYLTIEHATDRAPYTAYFRNPEANIARRSYRIVMKENVVIVMVAGGNTELMGTYDPETDRLTLPLIDGYPPLAFTRALPETALGFRPRVPAGKYVYRKPVAENDGWATASLAEVGLAEQPIAGLIEKILAAAPTRDNPVNIHSLLIARHGKLVLEEYFYGFDAERTHDMRSASKTFAPLMVGLAREHGAKIDVDAPIVSFFPEYKPLAHPDPRKDRITVRHLMTMTSGRACRGQWDEDPMQEQTEQPDWYKFSLDAPMEREPGGDQAVYCSSEIHLLGGIVKNTTGRWLPEFFQEYIARPLQMPVYHMNLTPTGEAYLGGGLYLRPRDQLKLGQLYLSGGTWNGRRIVSEQWAKESVARRAGFKPLFDIDAGHGYAYGWHVRDHKAGGRVFHDYYAGGNGGQLIIVIPELDMVVGFTGGDYAEARKFFAWEIELLPQYIIPAALNQR